MPRRMKPATSGVTSPVQYLRFEYNRGPSRARNAGIAASTGRYVAFLDDDNIWLPTRMKVQVPILEQQHDIGVVYGHGLAKDMHGNLVLWPQSGPSGRVFEEFLVRTDDFINIDTLLVRRDAIDRAGCSTKRSRRWSTMSLSCGWPITTGGILWRCRRARPRIKRGQAPPGYR